MATITTDKATERVGRSVNGSTKKYADEKARAEINKIFTDGAYAGQGYATCSTDATVAAKEATLNNFVPIKNVPVHVLFTKAVDVAQATLNINSTGAKPILIYGVPVQPGLINSYVMVTLIYDGTNYNIVGLTGYEQSMAQSDLWVDMGLPSGLKWAKRNIDITQANGFAASEYQYECSFFSWGNTDGHNPTSSDAFDYDWGTDNNTEPYVSSPGAAITGSITGQNDAARANLGAPWRMPNIIESTELFNPLYTKFIDADGNDIDASTTNKIITINGVNGIRLKSIVNGNIIFLPCSGYGSGTSYYERGSRGFYWLGSIRNQTQGRAIDIKSSGVDGSHYANRFIGVPIRPVL